MARDLKHDRSSLFDRIIVRRLAAERDSGGVQCPDASIIAAYRDRSLDRGDSALWERHFAQCARCAGMIAAVARIDDAIEPGRITSARTVDAGHRGWRTPRVAFPLAALGAAAIALMAIAVRVTTGERGWLSNGSSSEFQSKPLATNTLTTAAKPSAPPKSAGALSGISSLMAMNEAARAQPETPSARDSLAANVDRSAEAKSRLRDQATTSSRAQLLDKASASESDREKMAVAAATPPPPPPVPAAATAAREESDQSFSGGASSTMPAAPVAAPERVPPPMASSEGAPALPSPGGTGIGSGVAGTANRAATNGSAVGAAVAMSSANSGALMGSANGVVIKSADHAAIWMAGRNGTISRYNFAASGWDPQASGVTVDLVAGSAPSSSICWIVGRAGTILRTLDGYRWTKVSAPVSDDLVTVVATSAADATITDAAGVRFATADGGLTWRPQ
ncbi:MAG TPA: hypothetical protein VGG60_02350 [Candidatus Binataceae bacterium]